jgi:hypothetical protein
VRVVKPGEGFRWQGSLAKAETWKTRLLKFAIYTGLKLMTELPFPEADQ